MRRVVLRNLGVLLALVLPLSIVLGGVCAIVLKDAVSPTPIQSVVFWWASLLLPVLICGALHQIVLYFVSRIRGSAMRRFIIVASGFLIPVCLYFLGSNKQDVFAPEILIPLITGTVFYGTLAKPIRADGVIATAQGTDR